jgi:hypothetical protein
MKSRIERCDSKLKAQATSADVSAALYNVATAKVIGPYVEDPEIFQDFNRVIDEKSPQLVDDLTNVGVTSDQYIGKGMELALPRGDKG